jgi:hypothetical protein
MTDIKYRKVSSCKRIYESILDFFDENRKGYSFKLYKDEDIGIDEKYKDLLVINVSILILNSYNF